MFIRFIYLLYLNTKTWLWLFFCSSCVSVVVKVSSSLHLDDCRPVFPPNEAEIIHIHRFMTLRSSRGGVVVVITVKLECVVTTKAVSAGPRREVEMSPRLLVFVNVMFLCNPAHLHSKRPNKYIMDHLNAHKRRRACCSSLRRVVACNPSRVNEAASLCHFWALGNHDV